MELKQSVLSVTVGTIVKESSTASNAMPEDSTDVSAAAAKEKLMQIHPHSSYHDNVLYLEDESGRVALEFREQAL